MIIVAGTTHRSFIFPAPVPTAYAYYGDAKRMLTYLPYITVVRDYGDDCFQVMYERMELGRYRTRIFSNIQFVQHVQEQTLLVSPFKGGHLVKTEARLTASTAQGYFASQSIFQQAGDQTRIEYQVELRAVLPAPLGLRLMPGRIVDGIADQITNWRIKEIAEGFIERSIEAFCQSAV